jgi:hypothetical protein
MAKKFITNLELGLIELEKGKVHKYKSVKDLINDVWNG